MNCPQGHTTSTPLLPQKSLSPFGELFVSVAMPASSRCEKHFEDKSFEVVFQIVAGEQSWSTNRTGENRTGEPRPSTRGPFRGHLRGMFRGESLKG